MHRSINASFTAPARGGSGFVASPKYSSASESLLELAIAVLLLDAGGPAGGKGDGSISMGKFADMMADREGITAVD